MVQASAKAMHGTRRPIPARKRADTACHMGAESDLIWFAGAGLTSEDEDTDFVLEASQGDRISGKISRKEVARIAVAALGTAASVGEYSLREMKRACMHEIRAEWKGLQAKFLGSDIHVWHGRLDTYSSN